MPYHFEKGYWFGLFEEYVNGPFEQLLDGLEFLRSGTPLRSAEFLSLAELRRDPAFGSDPVAHVAADWFGRYERSDIGPGQDHLRGPDGFDDQLLEMLAGDPGGEVRTAIAGTYPSDVVRVRTICQAAVRSGLAEPFPATGFWHNYFGDVEAICRATLRVAVETALDIGPDDPVSDADPSHRLPIEMWWKCPQRWFEGWVMWRDVDAAGGGVTLIFATPGSGTQVVSNPSSPEEAASGWDSAVDPPVSRIGLPDVPPPAARRRSPRGMRVVSHASHVLAPPIRDSRPTPSGAWIIPDFGPTHIGVGDIVVAAPGKRHGGVDPHDVMSVSTGDSQ